MTSDEPQAQNPEQWPPKDPPKDPKDPCTDPKPPDEPCPPPDKPPCPPPETPCPPPKGCPGQPPPDPDPCAAPDEDDDDTPPVQTGETPTPATPAGDPTDPVSAQLEKLKGQLKEEQDQIQTLEPLKASVADITQRIQALEKTVDEQSSSEASYKDFYRQIEVFRKEIECFIPTVRCQLKLTKQQKECICKAVGIVDLKVDEAKAQSAKARKTVEKLERKYKQATDHLAWVKKWYEFLKAGLQQQITKQRDDLKALKLLADPSKDQCEVWFYLNELERFLVSSYDKGTACCWQPNLWISTFLDCWPWDDCYKNAWNKFIVDFNEAEAAEKLVKSHLEQAKKRAEELDKTAKDYQGKRREWILKEIKTAKCCGPFTDCPKEAPAANGGGGSAAR